MYKIKLKQSGMVMQNKYILYVYDVNGTEIRFMQSVELGGIYGVEITLPKEIKKVIDMIYVECINPDEIAYPFDVTIWTKGNKFALNDVYNHIECIKYASDISNAIMKIFDKDSDHWELYQRMKDKH